MTTLTRDHTTTSSDAGMLHCWSVAGDCDGRVVTLSALHTMHLDMPGVPDAGRDLLAATSNGVWVFEVIRLMDGSKTDSLGTDHARAAWDQIAAAGVTNDAVFAQLEQIHGQVFGGDA